MHAVGESCILRRSLSWLVRTVCFVPLSKRYMVSLSWLKIYRLVLISCMQPHKFSCWLLVCHVWESFSHWLYLLWIWCRYLFTKPHRALSQDSRSDPEEHLSLSSSAVLLFPKMILVLWNTCDKSRCECLWVCMWCLPSQTSLMQKEIKK